MTLSRVFGGIKSINCLSQRESMENYRDVALQAVEWFKSISSSDGSGHADLGLRIEESIDRLDNALLPPIKECDQ